MSFAEQHVALSMHRPLTPILIVCCLAGSLAARHGRALLGGEQFRYRDAAHIYTRSTGGSRPSGARPTGRSGNPRRTPACPCWATSAAVLYPGKVLYRRGSLPVGGPAGRCCSYPPASRRWECCSGRGGPAPWPPALAGLAYGLRRTGPVSVLQRHLPGRCRPGRRWVSARPTERLCPGVAVGPDRAGLGAGYDGPGGRSAVGVVWASPPPVMRWHCTWWPGREERPRAGAASSSAGYEPGRDRRRGPLGGRNAGGSGTAAPGAACPRPGRPPAGGASLDWWWVPTLVAAGWGSACLGLAGLVVAALYGLPALGTAAGLVLFGLGDAGGRTGGVTAPCAGPRQPDRSRAVDAPDDIYPFSLEQLDSSRSSSAWPNVFGMCASPVIARGSRPDPPRMGGAYPGLGPVTLHRGADAGPRPGGGHIPGD